LEQASVLKYQSGEDIKKGDRILYHGNPAEIEFVASNPGDPQSAWYIQEFGGGVMVLDPMVSGRTFIPSDQVPGDEDVEFVSRAEHQ
jgi:hypothetical protein